MAACLVAGVGLDQLIGEREAELHTVLTVPGSCRNTPHLRYMLAAA